MICSCYETFLVLMFGFGVNPCHCNDLFYKKKKKDRHNNSFQATIGIASYETLYGSKCWLPLYWEEVGEKNYWDHI